MNKSLVLGSTDRVRRAVGACRRAGLAADRPGRFGPGYRSVVILDVESFRSLARACGGPEELGRSAGPALVVLTPDGEEPSMIRRIVEAGGISVEERDLEVLPLLLRRLARPLGDRETARALFPPRPLAWRAEGGWWPGR